MESGMQYVGDYKKCNRCGVLQPAKKMGEALSGEKLVDVCLDVKWCELVKPLSDE